MTKVLIRLRRCAGWFEPLLFASNSQVSSRWGSYDVEAETSWFPPGYAPDNCAGFYDSLRAELFWISTKISYAGPVESLHENVLLLMITLATSECVN